ncbi:SbcC/MukB-like Walker B domain-containing protein [Enterococcus sp. AD013-P3]|uniref:SbcC/MukB-like Walker B domain-containing protein n=1 Tax=Enterococcus sp. AD013-P3 TaxID=3411036 RepID=UPI003B93C677
MQPRKLTLTNFGPFIQEEVDFAAFETNGLFLISGRTGAGKTTIFDGMTYALFGQTSGKLRSPKEMRSAFATPEEETEVRFTFEHGGFLYEVQRRPEQEVAKKRGNGMTKRAAKTTLTIFDSNGQEQRQISKDVDNYIQELLHLTADQFFKIVMLPQGEFRNFLVASSLDKEQVLRRLFDTQLYTHLNDWLKERVTAGGETLKLLDMKAQTLAEHFQWASATPPESVSLPELAANWQVDIAGLKEKEQLTEKQLLEAQKAEKVAEAAFYDGKERLGQFEELAKLEEAAEDLKAQAEEIAGARNKLQQLQWAKDNRHLLENQREQQLQEKLLMDKLASAQQLADELQQAFETWQKGQAAQRSRKEEMTQKRQHLTEKELQLPLARRSEEKRQEAASLQDSLAQVTERVQQLIQKETEKKAQLQQLALQLAEKTDLQEYKLQLTQLENLVEKLTDSLQQAKSAEQAVTDGQQQLKKIQQSLQQQQQKVQVTHEELLTLKSRQAALMIAKLSLDLRPGEPCPVCGALEHPKAHKERPEFSAAEISENELQLQVLETTWQQAEKDLTALETKAEQLAAELELLARKLTEAKVEQVRHENIFDEALAAINAKAVSIALADQRGTAADLTGDTTAEALVAAADSVAAAVSDTATPPQILSHLQKALQQKEEHLTKTAQQADLLQQELALLAVEIKNETTTQQQLTSQSQKLQGELAGLELQLGTARLPELEQAITELAETVTNLEATSAAYEEQGRQLQAEQLTTDVRLQQLTEALTTQQQKAAQATKALEELLESAPYEKVTAADLTELVATLSELEPLEKKISDFAQQEDFVTRRRQELQEKLKETITPELAPLDAAFEAARKVTKEVQEQLSKQQQQRINNEATCQELQQLIAANEVQVAQQTQLLQLADTVSGRNAYKTSLERYILQSYLQEILLVANTRLARLSRGRYQFQLADKETGGRGMKGLDIDIYDDNAGDARRVQTLSGGESFIAALALALSLADVIQNRAGGIAIEALFIDEGFGSLDEESLEMAMEALSMIETEGRMIGIISHVQELKTSIPRQILVKADGAGQSRIEMQLEASQ